MLVFTKRQRALLEIQRRRNDRLTYEVPLSDDDDLSPSTLQQRTIELQTYDSVRLHHEALVVSDLVSEDDFWDRYFHRTGNLDRVVQELDAPMFWEQMMQAVSSSASPRKQESAPLEESSSMMEETKENIDETKDKKVSDDDDDNSLPDKDLLLQRMNSSSRPGRESLGPGSLFSFVLPQLNQIQPPPPLTVAVTEDSNEANPSIQCDSPISPIVNAWKSFSDAVTNQRRTQSLDPASAPVLTKGSSRASLSPSALRGTTTDETTKAQASPKAMTEAAAEPSSQEKEIRAEEKQVLDMVEPMEKETDGISLVPLIFSIFVVSLAWMSTADEWYSFRQGFLCAPYIPSCSLPHRTFHMEAPWWAPGWTEGYQYVCPGTPQTKLQWEEGRKNGFRLTVRHGRKKQTYGPLQSVRIGIHELFLESTGNVETIPAPWAKN